MRCFHPITAWKPKTPNKNGKYQLLFKESNQCDREIQIACGKCIGCRLTKSLEWAVRCVHEAKYHEQSMFITLTYNDQSLPADAGLHHKDYQLFMKRYRKAYPNQKIRFFMCGEYGEKPQKESSVKHLTKTVVGKKKDVDQYLVDLITTQQYSGIYSMT